VATTARSLSDDDTGLMALLRAIAGGDDHDGGPTLRTWNPKVQARVVACLIELGADPNSVDESGVASLHRALRNRCAAAVQSLQAPGAAPHPQHRAGSTPMDLATHSTGCGGVGTPEARAEQQRIIRLLRGLGE
jgi:ankyrin repeat protein